MVIAALPSWWRFAQCLRRYYDTKQANPHLINAGKYSTSFFVVVFSAMAGGVLQDGKRTHHLQASIIQRFTLKGQEICASIGNNRAKKQTHPHPHPHTHTHSLSLSLSLPPPPPPPSLSHSHTHTHTHTHTLSPSHPPLSACHSFHHCITSLSTFTFAFSHLFVLDEKLTFVDQSLLYFVFFTLWILSGIVSTSYKLSWDILMDWSLFPNIPQYCCHKKALRLRKDKIYSYRVCNKQHYTLSPYIGYITPTRRFSG